jgi:hypothetical protein
LLAIEANDGWLVGRGYISQQSWQRSATKRTSQTKGGNMQCIRGKIGTELAGLTAVAALALAMAGVANAGASTVRP